MFRMRFFMNAVLAVAVLVTLAACGGGEGGGGTADTVEITITGLAGTTTTTYTEGPINRHGYYDPLIEAGIYTNTGRTIIMLTSGETGTGLPTTLINIVTIDHVVGDYPITGDGGSGMTTYISYTHNGVRYGSIVASGKVIIESIGGVGQPVVGSFSATLSSGADTLNVSGTFNVKREN